VGVRARCVNPPRSSAHGGHGLLLARTLGTYMATVTFEVQDQLYAFALPEGCVPGTITVEKLRSLIGERAQKEVLYHEKLKFAQYESSRLLQVDELVPLTPEVVKVSGPRSVVAMFELWLAKRGRPRPKEPWPQPAPKPVAPRAGVGAAQQSGGLRASGGVGHFGDVGSGFGRGGYGAAGSGVGRGMPTSLPDATHVALEQRQRQQQEERQLETALRASQMSVAADEEAQLKWALEESQAVAELENQRAANREAQLQVALGDSDDEDYDDLPPLEPLDPAKQTSAPEMVPDSEE